MPKESSKALIKDLFQLKEISRPPFIPWVSGFAAKLEQISTKDMFSDANLLFKAQRNAHRLFGYDGVVIAFNKTLESEACGCSITWEENIATVASHPLNEGLSLKDLEAIPIEERGHLPVVLEAVKRLNMVMGKEVALIAVITGPLTLAGHLKGPSFIAEVKDQRGEVNELIEQTGRLLIRLCRTYCELGMDVIVVAEGMVGRLEPDRSELIAPFLRTLGNIAKFYNVSTILLAKGCGPGHVEPLFQLQVDGIAIGGQIDYEYCQSYANKYNRCYGIALPSSSLLGKAVEARESIESCLRAAQKKGCFICTEDEVPFDTPVANLHEIMKAIRAGNPS
jgi:uroporphyrinogen decarboxylase